MPRAAHAQIGSGPAFSLSLSKDHHPYSYGEADQGDSHEMRRQHADRNAEKHAEGADQRHHDQRADDELQGLAQPDFRAHPERDQYADDDDSDSSDHLLSPIWGSTGE